MKTSSFFKSELDLVQYFCNFLKCGGLPNQAKVALEFESGHGIADIVICENLELFEPGAIEFAKLPPRYAVIFGQELLSKKFSVQQFSDLTGTGLKASARMLNMLSTQDVLISLKNGEYESLGSYVSPVGSIISIEAKLRDWKSALRQAYRYREFSNQSWVLMDAARVKPALNQLPIFIRSGVGLASFNTSGNLFIHHEPFFTAPFSESRYWAACVQLTRCHLKDL